MPPTFKLCVRFEAQSASRLHLGSLVPASLGLRLPVRLDLRLDLGLVLGLVIPRLDLGLDLPGLDLLLGGLAHRKHK